ncbi:MAG: hypothetical protein U0797_12775 [Gemmataceae bacterium]
MWDQTAAASPREAVRQAAACLRPENASVSAAAALLAQAAVRAGGGEPSRACWSPPWG